MRAFGLQLPDECIDVTLAGTDGAEGDDLSVVFFGDRGDRNRVFMDIQTDVECARLRAWLTSERGSWCRHEAALALVSSPAVHPEVSLPIGSHYV